MGIVITVSRQLGSNGSYIATEVAERLGLRYIDREILHRAAEAAGFPDEEMVALLEREEAMPGFLRRFVDALNAMPMVPTIASATIREGYVYPQEVYDVVAEERAKQQLREEAGRAYTDLVQQVMRDYVQTGGVVIVGRGGQVVLRDFANVLHVRVLAPAEVRIRNLMKRQGIGYGVAEEMVRKGDKQRERYVKHFYAMDWSDPDLYHLVLNTSKVSVKMGTHIVCEAARWLEGE